MAFYGHVEMTVSDGNGSKSFHLYSFFCPVLSPWNKIFFPLCFIHYMSFSLCICVCVCMNVCIYTYIRNTVFFTTHCTVAPLTFSPSQKGRGIGNAKLAPDHASESAKAYIRTASSNNTNSSFSCSLFIGLDRQQETDTLFYS